MSKKNTQNGPAATPTSGSFELSQSTRSSSNLHGLPYSREGFVLSLLNPMDWLPSSFGGFVRFLIFAAVLATGTVVHIHLSSQILDAKIQQSELEEEYLAVQRQNSQIAWQLAEYTSLDQVRQRAVNIGYTHSLRPSYAFSPISDDTLAVLDATILNGVGETWEDEAAQTQAQASPSRGEETTDSIGGRLGQESALVANASANRLIENGLLEAVKVINGR